MGKKDTDDKFNLVHMGQYFHFRNHLCINFELMGYGVIDRLGEGRRGERERDRQRELQRQGQRQILT